MGRLDKQTNLHGCCRVQSLPPDWITVCNRTIAPNGLPFAYIRGGMGAGGKKKPTPAWRHR
jgi:hypothetical protein